MIGRALLVVAALATAVHAEPARKPRSRTTGVALAGIGTGVSTGLVIYGLFHDTYNSTVDAPFFIAGLASSVVTPSLGQFYAGEYLTWGELVRTLAGATIAYGAVGLDEHKACLQPGGATGMCAKLTENSVFVLGLGAIAYIGGVAWDVLDAGDAVDRYNRTQGFYVAPTVSAAPSERGLVPTFGVAGTF